MLLCPRCGGVSTNWYSCDICKGALNSNTKIVVFRAIRDAKKRPQGRVKNGAGKVTRTEEGQGGEKQPEECIKISSDDEEDQPIAKKRKLEDGPLSISPLSSATNSQVPLGPPTSPLRNPDSTASKGTRLGNDVIHIQPGGESLKGQTVVAVSRGLMKGVDPSLDFSKLGDDVAEVDSSGEREEEKADDDDTSISQVAGLIPSVPEQDHQHQPFKCPKCPGTFHTKDELDEHMMKIVQQCYIYKGSPVSAVPVYDDPCYTPSLGEKILFVCDNCRIGFRYVSIFMNHKQGDGTCDVEKCTECNENFVRGSQLESHKVFHEMINRNLRNEGDDPSIPSVPEQEAAMDLCLPKTQVVDYEDALEKRQLARIRRTRRRRSGLEGKPYLFNDRTPTDTQTVHSMRWDIFPTNPTPWAQLPQELKVDAHFLKLVKPPTLQSQHIRNEEAVVVVDLSKKSK